MKRLLIVFSVVISSFFLFNEDVNAAEYSYDLSNHSTYINDTYYLVKRQAEVYFNQYSADYDNYFIDYSTSGRNYNIYLFKGKGSLSFESSRIKVTIPANSFLLQTTDGKKITERTLTSSSLIPSNSYALLYHSNDFLLSSSYEKITLKVNDYSHVVLPGERFIFLEELYNSSIGYVPDIHAKEKETLLNFYTICIEKIEYLSTQISNNYIYLSMITIFILIVVIGLLRRYLL